MHQNFGRPKPEWFQSKPFHLINFDHVSDITKIMVA